MHLKTDTSANAHFSMVPTISRSRNAFSIAEKHVTTIQFDRLYPIYWKYIYPGDTISVQIAKLARLNTQVTTLYDDLYFDLHAWYVPFRLIQNNWARFQFNAQPAGPSQDNSSLTTPNIDLASLDSGQFVPKSIYDYLGFPTSVGLGSSGQWINNYAARAYQLIWNDNYRDENLQTAAVVDLDEGPDDASDYGILPRGKRHDKFTSALPFQQKGAPVTLPLGSTAPIEYVLGNPMLAREYTTGTLITSGSPTFSAGGGWERSPDTLIIDPNGSLVANLASAVGATLNQVRQSYAVQHLLEADARGGTRDVESIQHRWGVTVPDFRLQRPEYLGGQTFTFDGQVVPQTSATVSGGTPQANLAQFSQAMNFMNLTHSFVEHGVMMVLISARSNITYQQGLQREFSYKTRFDFYQPEFSNLGEVAILNKEIYLQGTTADNSTFGFQEFGYELRYSQNRVTAEMRSNYSESLDTKHMADDYSTLPTLSAAWIESNTPISRNLVVSAEDADPIELNVLTTGKIARTLPMFSIPGLNRL